MTVLVVRPRQKLKASLNCFAKAGIRVGGMAVLESVPLADAAKKIVLQFQDPQFIAVFTSTVAASQVVKTLTSLPQSPIYVAVGKSSAAPLLDVGVECQVPEQESSEGVLALPLLNKPANKPVCIFKGQGGRNVLAPALRARGYQVHEVALYRRDLLAAPFKLGNWQENEIRCIIVTSAEQIQALFSLCNKNWLMSLPFIVVSPRLQKVAHQFGIEQVLVSAGADDYSLISEVKDFLEH